MGDDCVDDGEACGDLATLGHRVKFRSTYDLNLHTFDAKPMTSSEMAACIGLARACGFAVFADFAAVERKGTKVFDFCSHAFFTNGSMSGGIYHAWKRSLYRLMCHPPRAEFLLEFVELMTGNLQVLDALHALRASGWLSEPSDGWADEDLGRLVKQGRELEPSASVLEKRNVESHGLGYRVAVANELVAVV